MNQSSYVSSIILRHWPEGDVVAETVEVSKDSRDEGVTYYLTATNGEYTDEKVSVCISLSRDNLLALYSWIDYEVA